jgi:ABC-2 type transport system ATP-binding protein
MNGVGQKGKAHDGNAALTKGNGRAPHLKGRKRNDDEYCMLGFSKPQRHGAAPSVEVAAALADTNAAVQAIGLRKAYGERVAVERVDLYVPRGAFFGVVGPNGAGKTTTLRMITCLLRPDEGTVIVDGLDVWADPVLAKTRFGVLPDDLRLFERLTGREFLTYVGLLRRLPEDLARQRCEEVLEVLGLLSSSNELVTDYSQGMRKKIALGAAILHVPSVLFLDEPFESVDPVSARVVQDVLGHYREAGGTVVFSSHVMETVERLCDHVAIVHGGRVIASGHTEDVRNGRTLEERFIESVGASEVRLDHLDWLRSGLRDSENSVATT